MEKNKEKKQIIEYVKNSQFEKALECLINRFGSISPILNNNKFGISRDIKIYENNTIEQLKIIFIQGILWEILGNFIFAHFCYDFINIKIEKSKDIKISDELNIAFKSFQIQICAKLGKNKEKIKFFDELKQHYPQFNNILFGSRPIIGFRDRFSDIISLKKYHYKNPDLILTQQFLLGLLNFSIGDYKESYNTLRTFSWEDNPEAKLLNHLSHIITSESHNEIKNSIEELNKMTFPGNKYITREITRMLNLLTLRKNKLSNFDFNPNDIYKSKFISLYNEYLKYINGWMSIIECFLLYSITNHLGKKFKNKLKIIEIGAFHGRSSISIGLALKILGFGRLYSIDPHEGIENYHPERTDIHFTENIKKPNLENFIRVIRKYSFNAADLLNSKYHLIFIDGNHEYTAVKKDFKLYSQKLVEGGYILFHDNTSAGPFRLINEIIANEEYFLIQNICGISILKKMRKDFDFFESNKINHLNQIQQIFLLISRLNHLNFQKSDLEYLKSHILKYC